MILFQNKIKLTHILWLPFSFFFRKKIKKIKIDKKIKNNKKND